MNSSSIKIATFNANNLFIRYKFGKTFPGDLSKKSIVSQATGGIGYLPQNVNSSFEIWNDTQRMISAKVLTDNFTSFPDIIFFQEIESLIALRLFNEKFLRKYYQKALVIDSWDFRQVDVGILTNLEMFNIKTHVDDLDPLDPSNFLFSRDCLMVDFKLGNGKIFTAFLNHFKSKFVDPFCKDKEEQTKIDNAKRKRQASKVIELIEERFPGEKKNSELFAVIGDFNDEPKSDAVSPLFSSPFLIDPIERLPQEERWTYYWKGHTVSQIDNILLSPKLDQITKGILPRIERRGTSFQRVLKNGKSGPKEISLINSDKKETIARLDFQFERFPDVNMKNYSSDHCPVFFEIPID